MLIFWYFKEPFFLSRIINLYFELKDGYLAQLQKSHMKRPPIKTYTIKDYRNFKKDAPTNTNSNTGKLGFDYDNEYYKQKVWEILFNHYSFEDRIKKWLLSHYYLIIYIVVLSQNWPYFSKIRRKTRVREKKRAKYELFYYYNGWWKRRNKSITPNEWKLAIRYF